MAKNDKSAGNGDDGDLLRDQKDDYVKSEAKPIPDDERGAKVAELRSTGSELAGKLVSAQEARAQAEAEYQDLVRQAAENNAKLTQMVGQPRGKPTTDKEIAEQARRDGQKLVRVYVPKSFQHRLDDHTLIDVGAGPRDVPESLAKHWWFAANGVQVAA